MTWRRSNVVTLNDEDWSKVIEPQRRDVGVRLCIPLSSSLQLVSNYTILPERPKIKPNIRYEGKNHLFKYKLERKHTKTRVYDERFGHSSPFYKHLMILIPMVVSTYTIFIVMFEYINCYFFFIQYMHSFHLDLLYFGTLFPW